MFCGAKYIHYTLITRGRKIAFVYELSTLTALEDVVTSVH